MSAWGHRHGRDSGLPSPNNLVQQALPAGASVLCGSGLRWLRDEWTVAVCRCGIGRPARLDRLVGVNPVTEFRLIAMDFGRIEVADEGQDFAAENLTGHQHGESRRIRCDESR